MTARSCFRGDLRSEKPALAERQPGPDSRLHAVPFSPFVFLAFPAVSLILYVAGAHTAAWAQANISLIVLILYAARNTFLPGRQDAVSGPERAPQPVSLSELIDERETPADEDVAEPETAEPFEVSREQLRQAGQAQVRQAAQMVETALSYSMPSDAREWAEDAVRFLRSGKVQTGLDALTHAAELCSGPVAAKHLWQARQVLISGEPQP